jgi:spore coat protein H
MGRGGGHFARGLPWLLVLCMAAVACAPPSGWSVAPPECDDTDSASFVTGFESREGGAPDPFTYVEEDGLPVFHIFMSASLPDEDGYRPARFVYRGRCYVAEMRYRGDTSLAGGFMGRRKLVLTSPFNDNSYLRARLAFELWNRMSPDHLPVQAYSAVVYMNGRYQGLYTVMDHIDRDYLSAHGLDPGGDLFKAVGGDANFSRFDSMGGQKKKLHQGYEKKAGKPEDGDEAYRTIDALTAFVADATPEQFLAERGDWVDVSDYEDWWILSTLMSAKDSVAKNAYHFRARGTGARFRYIPWDLDTSFGQDWNTTRLHAEDLDPYTRENRVFSRMLEDPAIAGPLRERYRALLQGPLSRDVVLGLIDGYVRELEPAALKDEARWGKEYKSFRSWSWRTDFNDFEGEVAYLRAWVDTRWRVLEESLR